MSLDTTDSIFAHIVLIHFVFFRTVSCYRSAIAKLSFKLFATQ